MCCLECVGKRVLKSACWLKVLNWWMLERALDWRVLVGFRLFPSSSNTRFSTPSFQRPYSQLINSCNLDTQSFLSVFYGKGPRLLFFFFSSTLNQHIFARLSALRQMNTADPLAVSTPFYYCYVQRSGGLAKVRYFEYTPAQSFLFFFPSFLSAAS